MNIVCVCVCVWLQHPQIFQHSSTLSLLQHDLRRLQLSAVSMLLWPGTGTGTCRAETQRAPGHPMSPLWLWPRALSRHCMLLLLRVYNLSRISRHITSHNISSSWWIHCLTWLEELSRATKWGIRLRWKLVSSIALANTAVQALHCG